MSRAQKSGSAAGGKGEEIPFEEALKRLESTVESMENDELSLDHLLARYEEGMRLTRLCQAKLAEAELKIQQLEKSEAGELTLTPFEEEAECRES